ncbi:hypothetical protein AB2B38_005100 [Balneola sp. MJW-20]|uniref:hypothetical protein n=1 Tax=Gracilimonas aurantiaca TaxID=3234185 RepID=UPI003467416E
MHKEVEKIIDRLVGAVKSDKPFYTLQELLSAGFPAFIVERIRMEINEKIKSEIMMPETFWVDMNSRLVQEEWYEFKSSLYSNSRIPQNEFYELVKSVVNEIVKVYLEPRRYMADYIYKSEEELDFSEIVERTNRLTIYKHFGKAVPLYMQKRKLKKLEKKRCRALIQNLDARLVSSYSAEDWAKVLELLFRLFGGSVDAKLLQLFFEDKGLYLTAKALNAIEGSIDKDRFIEVLSYPDLLDVQLQEKFKEQFREVLNEQKNRFDAPLSDEDEEVIDEKEQALLDNFFGSYDYAVPPDEQESLNALFKSEGDYKSIFDDFEDTPDTEDVHETFKGDPQKRGEDMQRFRANLMDVLDEAVISFKKLDLEQTDEDAPPEKKAEADQKKEKKKAPEKNKESAKKADEEKKAQSSSEETEEEDISTPEEETDDRPMWQQFLSDDHMKVIMGSENGKETENDSDYLNDENDDLDDINASDDFVDEDILDSFRYDDDNESDAGSSDQVTEYDDSTDDPEEETAQRSSKAADNISLKEMLGPYKEYFSDEIFGGSKRSFNSAVKELEKIKSWDKASSVLKKKIFEKHEVDITSEAAVEFTDLLQSYFKKQK